MVFEPNLSRRMTARSTMTVAALLLVFAMQLIHVAHVYSLNWDEAHHLYDGYNIWTHDDYRLNAEVPPLVKLTAALPLLHMHLAEPQSPGKTQALNAFLGGRNFVLANGGDRIVLPARMVCMLYSLLLALLLYFSTREMFGTVAASTAILLFVFDPNVLAHGTLISTDVACACFFFAAVYAFYRFAKHPTAGRLVLTGFFAGLATSAKFTGIFIIPLLVILAVAEAVFARSTGILWRRLAACAAILLCGWVMLWAFYRFRYAPAPQGLELSPSLAPYIAAMPGRGGAALSF